MNDSWIFHEKFTPKVHNKFLSSSWSANETILKAFLKKGFMNWIVEFMNFCLSTIHEIRIVPFHGQFMNCIFHELFMNYLYRESLVSFVLHVLNMNCSWHWVHDIWLNNSWTKIPDTMNFSWIESEFLTDYMCSWHVHELSDIERFLNSSWKFKASP